MNDEYYKVSVKEFIKKYDVEDINSPGKISLISLGDLLQTYNYLKKHNDLQTIVRLGLNDLVNDTKNVLEPNRLNKLRLKKLKKFKKSKK